MKTTKLCAALRELQSFDIHYQTENTIMLGFETRTADFDSFLILPFLNLLKNFAFFPPLIFGTSLQMKSEIMINVISKM